jgi:hypothetical protein
MLIVGLQTVGFEFLEASIRAHTFEKTSSIHGETKYLFQDFKVHPRLTATIETVSPHSGTVRAISAAWVNEAIATSGLAPLTISRGHSPRWPTLARSR